MVESSSMLTTRLAGCKYIVSIDGDRAMIDAALGTNGDCCKADSDLKRVIDLSGALLWISLPWGERELWWSNEDGAI
jgi:hypothetical protein